MWNAWLRTIWARFLLGLAVGAAVGVVVFQASALSGRSVFVLAGATAGSVAALVVHAYSRTARLSEVTLTIPHLSELHFVVTKDSQQVAWKLFVETVTRISTQPLDPEAGRLREALTSLYDLFDITRETLKQSQPSRTDGGGPTVEHLAITMLNRELRPFLSRWHPALRAWESGHDADESSWPDNSACRCELREVQQRIRQYALGFARLAGVDDPAAIVGADTWATPTPPPKAG